MSDPVSIGELITQFAQEYDPKRDADTQTMCAMIQGCLAGYSISSSDAALGSLVKVDYIETPTDAKGNYKHYFVIITESGLRIRVTIEPD